MEYEVIVVDDGSTDCTVSIISTYVWKQLKLVGFRRNQGHQAALHLGMRISKGDLVVGNIKQPKIFHYIEKDFITDSIIEKLRSASGV